MSTQQWVPQMTPNSFRTTLPVEVNLNIQRTSSPSGSQFEKSHWQLPTGQGTSLPSFEDRRIVELWEMVGSTWYLRDWVTLTIKFNSVYILRDPANTGYWYGNNTLSTLGKTLHLYSYGGSMGPWSDGSNVVNMGYPSPRPGGVNPQPKTSCPTCDRVEDPYYGSYPSFDPLSYAHPYSQSQCDSGAISSDNASLHLKIGMGQAGFGRIGGILELHSLMPAAHLLDPGALTLSAIEGFEEVFDPDTNKVLQFVSPATVADVIRDPGGNGYSLRFFNRKTGAVREGENGVFVLEGEPDSVVRVENPDGAPEDGVVINRVRISRSAKNGAEVASEFNWDDGAQSWVLTEDDGNKIETVRTIQSDNLEAYTKIRTVVDATGETQVSTIEEYRRLDIGDRLVRVIRDPKGSALITSWQYYTDPADQGSLGNIKQILRPDGSWERYEYDFLGRRTKTITPFQVAPVDAEEKQCAVTETKYAAFDPDKEDSGLRVTEIKRLLGKEVSRNYIAYRDGVIEEIVAHSPGAPWDHKKNQVTRKQYYTDGPFVGDLKWIVRPDGSATTYQYELDGDGLLDSTQLTKTVLTGKLDDTTDAENRGRAGRDNDDADSGFPVIKDGSQSISLVNSSGNTIAYQSEDTRTGRELSSWVATRIDASGRVEEKTYSDGSTESKSYGCCTLDASTDRQGITTTYSKVGDRSIRTRQGMGEATEVVGREVRKGRIGTDGKEVPASTKVYDLAGRVIRTTDAMGRATTYAYATDGEGRSVKTTTNPDGSTRVVVTWPDGRTERTYGTAVHPVRYEYGVESPGDGIEPQLYRKQIALNRDGTDSGEWTTTFTDSHGRSWRTLRSFKNDKPAVTSNYYDERGRTLRSVNPDGATTLYAYFEEGDTERTIQALDMNGNGAIDYDGNDRITETTTEIVQLTPEEQEKRKTTSIQGPGSSSSSSSQASAPTHIRRSTSKVWTTNGDDTATRIVSISESTLDGDQSWQSANGRDASSSKQDTSPGSEIRTSIAADGSRSVVHTEQGREVRSEAYDPDGTLVRSTITEYDEYARVTTRTTTDAEGEVLTSEGLEYDPLGRVLRRTDHQGRITETVYNADNSVASTIVTVGDKVLTTEIAYDPMGRRSVVTRPDGKQVRYDYWPTGENRKVEGAGTYTASYAYTDQGRLQTLTTAAGDTHWEYDIAGNLSRKVYL
ncbi:MAG: RHS repeat protein, partial [Verrucomicrobiae bacterium]|nr:RHS repeat protein [Verrucomicrobiae bacterium]